MDLAQQQQQQCTYLSEPRHQCLEALPSADEEFVPNWRLKDRMRTSCVALVICLNIGVDPPDVIKVSPCARIECWTDPLSMPSQKALETIGKTLQAQYERWQPRARYGLQLDPTDDELKSLCMQSRRNAKVERVLFHYNGHGVPKPTKNGELWFFNKNYTKYMPKSIYEIDAWVGTPSIYVLDCSGAGSLMNAFVEMSSKDCILLAACGADELLPQSAAFPADVFTSCLTTPIKMAMKWFCSRSLLGTSLDPELVDKIPGRQDDRKTLLGELNWIFTAITDAIAWNVLPRPLFQRLFRQDLLVAALFRNFLLAERIMRSTSCSPESYPRLPMTHQHSLWNAWDMALELCIAQLPSLVGDPNGSFQPSLFFAQQLTAFELWLDYGSEKHKPPEQLPIVLQVLFSQSHRHRALLLFGKFLDMGAWAIDMALSVGIFPYVLKLLQTTATDVRQILVFIWAKILAVDKSCQADLVKDGGHQYFIRFLDSPDIYPEQAAMAAFVLAAICDGHSRGQLACLRAGLMDVCLRIIQSSVEMGRAEPLLLQWLCLCLTKLWHGQTEAQFQALSIAPAVLEQLLAEPQPEVRAAAAAALGALIGVRTDNDEESVDEEDEEDRLRMEQEVMKDVLRIINDGSPLVRSEAAIALARLTVNHGRCLRAAAAAYLKPPSTPSSISLAGFGLTKSSAGSLSGSSGSSQFFFAGRLFGEQSGAKALAIRNTSLATARATASAPASPSEVNLARDDTAAALPRRPPSEDSGAYVQCVAAAYALVRDPCPWVASLGRDALRRIGVEAFIMPAGKALMQQNGGLKRSASWIDSGLGIPFISSVSPPKPPFFSASPVALRRVPSMEFYSQQNASKDTKAAETEFADEKLPESVLYKWSCSHFAQPLLEADDEEDEEVSALRDERQKTAFECISKCRASATKITDQIASLQSDTGVNAVLLHPFKPLVCTGEGKTTISVWDYDAGALVNTFPNCDQGEEVVSSLRLINELSNELLLVASSEGNVRVWRNFLNKDEQQLATAWQAIQGRRPGARGLNTVVDWQQSTGYLYASGEVSSVMVWDLDRELLASRIPARADTSVSAISASQVGDAIVMAGCGDGSLMLFDIRKQEMLVASSKAHTQRTVGLDFCQSKVISASVSGEVKIWDVRSSLDTPVHTVEAHKGHMTSLAVHRHAPVFATGSSKQSIRVFSSHNGEALSMIRYHNSFLGQRIGPVTSLAFHPYALRLAAGAADANVSVYAGPGDAHSS